MSICLHYRIYQVLTPHIASPRVMNWGLSWGLINHIQACLSPLFWSYLFVYTVFFVGGLLLAYDTIGHSVWCQLGYQCCDYSWILSDFYMTMYFPSLVILPFSLFICYLFLLPNSHLRNRFTWVSNCDSIILNDKTLLLCLVFYIITCLYLFSVYSWIYLLERWLFSLLSWSRVFSRHIRDAR